MITLLDILITLLTISIAVIPLYKDVIIKKENAPGKGFIKRITKSGWCVIGIALFLIGCTYLKDVLIENSHKNERDQDLAFYNRRHFNDSVKSDKDKASLKQDLTEARDTILAAEKNGFLGIKKGDSTSDDNPELQPCPLIYGNRQNPIVKPSDSANSILVHISICNVGNRPARNIRSFVTLINYINNKPYFDETVESAVLNKSVVISPKEPGRIIPLGFDFKDRNSSTISMFLFKIVYTNSSNKKKTLRKIYAIDLLENKILEAGGQNYDIAMRDLKKSNRW